MKPEHLSQLRTALNRMGHSPLLNYALPGLTSSLIGGEGQGKVRLFTATRETQELITPHSHRFAFTCLVLQGKVTNRIYRPAPPGHGDLYVRSDIEWVGPKMGDYQMWPAPMPVEMAYEDTVYRDGQVYSMEHEEIHSIFFGRDSQVLFLEGKSVSAKSAILEPFVNGERVPTFKTEKWMFQALPEATPA